MAQSYTAGDIMSIFAQNAVERQIDAIKGRFIIIAVHDDEEQVKIFKTIATKNTDSIRKTRVFDNVDACYDFVIEKVSSDPHVDMVVFVGGGLVSDLVSCIHPCQQVRLILITNKSPFCEEERESMKMYPKVRYTGDLQRKEIPGDWAQQSDAEVTHQTRFDEPMSFDLVENEESDEDILQVTEPIERTCKQLDGNLVFRFVTLMCLRNVPPLSSDKNDLIKLFETKYFIPPESINKFNETYSSSQAILFYTRDEFIFGRLNSALRTTNICHLLPFRFVCQDICNALHEMMTQEADNQILTVYRGQISSSYEVADLFSAYCQKSFIISTTFLSTSKSKDHSLFFLSAGNLKPFDTKFSRVLFKITARKQDGPFYFPFADISKVSHHPEEEEVLFAPGQIFNIDSFEIITEKDKNIFLFEMSLKNDPNKSPARLETTFNAHENPLLILGTMLTGYKRFDEAKELYMQLLSAYDDIDKKCACYQRLLDIAIEQKDKNEINNIDQTMTQMKFGIENIPSNPIYESMSREDSEQIFAGLEQVKNLHSSFSLTRPIDEQMNILQSEEFRNKSKQFIDSIYPLAKTYMKNGIYDQAIGLLKMRLKNINLFQNIQFEPLFVARCYMQLGHCYRELKSYDKALKNYNLSLEQNVYLPLDEYIEILTVIGKTLEAMNNYADALTRYIKVAKIYNDNSTVGNPTERHDIEETIQRILPHLIPKDETCKIN